MFTMSFASISFSSLIVVFSLGIMSRDFFRVVSLWSYLFSFDEDILQIGQ